MTLRDLLKKKDRIDQEHAAQAVPPPNTQFTILRSDTNTQELLNPPPGAPVEGNSDEKRRFGLRNRSGSSQSKPLGRERSLSALFHRPRSHSRAQSSNVPEGLDNIEDRGASPEDKEAQWEKRATVLVQGNLSLEVPDGSRSGAGRPRSISDAKTDDDVAKAIELHESGELEQSTAMFGRLADPKGENNALSQVLYGMALRHGWGIPPNPQSAVQYLTLAARNSADVEAVALRAGNKGGGAAKGELVLAVYELANCYADGLGVDRDPVAARRYYETAAQLGDVDALEQAARCYEQGIGGKKDKFTAAKYYRMAEDKGHKIVGNSWIWKEKYDPKP